MIQKLTEKLQNAFVENQIVSARDKMFQFVFASQTNAYFYTNEDKL